MSEATWVRRTFEPCLNPTCRLPVAIDHVDGLAGLLCVEHLKQAIGIDLSFVDGEPRKRVATKAKFNPMKNARKLTLDDLDDNGELIK